jgi:hypothetical protein
MNCLACRKPLSVNYTSTVVRKAIKPPRMPHRWITLGSVHEGCEHLVKLENDPWSEKKVLTSSK